MLATKRKRLIVLLISKLALAESFHASSFCKIGFKSRLFSKEPEAESFDDGIGDVNNQDNQGGQDLAKDFYEQLKKRDANNSDNNTSNSLPSDKENDLLRRLESPSPNPDQEIFRVGDEAPKVKIGRAHV